MSKGDGRRPTSATRDTVDDNWTRTFGRAHLQLTVDGPMPCAEDVDACDECGEPNDFCQCDDEGEHYGHCDCAGCEG